MIISRLIGGLGNQMFQYAFARRLAMESNQSLLLDLSGFNNYRLHNGFELNMIFDINGVLASKNDIHYVLGWQSNFLYHNFFLRPIFQSLHHDNLILESSFNYCKDIKVPQGNSYVAGYWQTEKYFKAIEQIIRREFKFKPPVSGYNQSIINEISKCVSVSLHVRRGDYISNTKNLSIYEVCDFEYYNGAVDLMRSKLNNPRFFIFSDDIDWVRENLNLGSGVVFVDQNKEIDSYNDMRLMSLCKHNIIANSTFSWWGAWLNPNPAKIVISPKWWFKNKKNMADLLPPEWLVL
ncbi:alpha-1,2-fucosyltransferase [Methylophilaceae bacterium]|nr:alpha-1,2-fucosyltransferase [Methylophilaceae bacterium]